MSWLLVVLLEADLVDALRASRKATLSLVAVEETASLANILFSPVSIDAAERTFPRCGIGTDGYPP